ncbi:hypothetical protein CEXT_527811 [Caerostris extrusa]|uniref:Uncharacterized protein n=1 Tax=Caerostris extrusa TaxID=172846 RepID=A0AAV4XUL5_CAEEX|nr:hypothetical protein CEXT_527811 [Caerostris extrusa]
MFINISGMTKGLEVAPSLLCLVDVQRTVMKTLHRLMAGHEFLLHEIALHLHQQDFKEDLFNIQEHVTSYRSSSAKQIVRISLDKKE